MCWWPPPPHCRRSTTAAAGPGWTLVTCPFVFFVADSVFSVPLKFQSELIIIERRSGTLTLNSIKFYKHFIAIAKGWTDRINSRRYSLNRRIVWIIDNNRSANAHSTWHSDTKQRLI
jgi:hypothetical protein